VTDDASVAKVEMGTDTTPWIDVTSSGGASGPDEYCHTYSATEYRAGNNHVRVRATDNVGLKRGKTQYFFGVAPRP
jgi:hypothetical protein